MSELKYEVGNLFDNIPKKGIIMIAHVVNNIKVMGAGFVIPLMKHFPTIKEKYIEASEKYEKDLLLGKVYYHVEKDNKDVFVANMFAQDGVGLNHNKPHPLSYDALERCMIDVRLAASAMNSSKIICPKFGAGLSSGDWRIIEAMIKVLWIEKNKDVTVYVLDKSELMV